MPHEGHVAGIVGTGAMGAGIAVAFALAGWEVRALARRTASRERAERRLAEALAGLSEAGLVDAPALAGARSRIAFLPTVAEVTADARLVVESVPEDVGLKREVLADISARAPREALIVTNTSSLPLAGLSGAVDEPGRFAGLHWFLPAELVEVVEVIAAPLTAAGTVATLVEVVSALGRTPVVVRRPVPGFVVNRLQYALLREAYALVEEGVCDAADIDRSVVGCLGPRWSAIGPLQSMDLAGLDVHLAAARSLFPSLAAGDATPRALEDLVPDGRLGAKSGSGLRGDYQPDDLAAIAHRRAAVVAALRRARHSA